MKSEIAKTVQNLVSEYGTNDPFELAIDKLKKIAEYFNVPLEELLKE